MAGMEEALADPGDTAADPDPESSNLRYYGMQWEVYALPSTPDALPVFGHRGATGTLGMALPEQDVIVIYLTGSEENGVVDEVIEAVLEMFGN